MASSKEVVAAHKVYKDISRLEVSKTNRRVRYLQVELAHKKCKLRIKKVGPPGNRENIAYYDPRIAKLRDAGAAEVAERLIYLKTDVIVTPSSDKSGIMIALAAQRAAKKMGKKIDVIVLKRGKPGSKEMRPYEKTAAYKTKYYPITADGEEREMIVTKTDREVIADHIRDGHIITGADDVLSSGGTAGAVDTSIRKIYRYATGKPMKDKLNFVSVMQEAPRDKLTGELNIPTFKNIVPFPAIVTPVFRGRLPPRVAR